MWKTLLKHKKNYTLTSIHDLSLEKSKKTLEVQVTFTSVEKKL